MAAGANTDWNNRQLHPDERKWIVNHAKDFARRLNGGREPTQAEIAQAERRLAQQAAKDTDLLWMITLPKTTDMDAQTFLRSARGSFTNQFGKSQRYFTTQGRDFIRPELYAIEANKDLRFYYRNLISSENKNIIRGTQDFAAKLGNQAVKAFRNDPIEAGLKTAAPVGNAIFNGAKGGVHCLRNLSHCGRQVYRGTIDYFQGLGTSLREGATSLQLNNLRPIYGQNVRGIQGALLTIQAAEVIFSAREAASILGSVKTGSIATANAVLHPVQTVNKARNAVSGFVIGRRLNNLPKTEVPLSELLRTQEPRVMYQPDHRPAANRKVQTGRQAQANTASNLNHNLGNNHTNSYHNNRLDTSRKHAEREKIFVDFEQSQIKGTPERNLVNNLRANADYELSNGTRFKTNQYGHVEELSFKPDFENPRKRDHRQTEIGRLGLDGDVGGHIQACSFGGTCDAYNIFPQNGNFNNSAYKTYYEGVVRRAHREGKRVENVTVKLGRSDPSVLRPDTVEVSFTINGVKSQPINFRNVHGGGINQ